MAVYYKFKSEKCFNSISLGNAPSISIAKLKEQIFQAKRLYRGKDCYLVVSNAQTNEEYFDEEMQIPKYMSVLIRRVPGWRPNVGNEVVETEPKTIVVPAVDTSAMKSASADEDHKIKARIDTRQSNRHRRGPDSFVPSRRLGRGMDGWMAGQHGLQQKTPPPGYVCHRCRLPGHFIHQCPTNGDPNYDFKRVRPPIGLQHQSLDMPFGSVTRHQNPADDSKWDDFADGLSATPHVFPVQSSKITEVTPTNMALIDTPQSNRQGPGGSSLGRGLGGARGTSR